MSSMPASWAAATMPYRWSVWLCTPPGETSPIRCRRPVPRFTRTTRSVQDLRPLNSPLLMLLPMRTSSWSMIRPAPMVRCPTSLLPIWPSGRPTAGPQAVSVVQG